MPNNGKRETTNANTDMRYVHVSAAAIGHLCCQIGAELQRANDDNAVNHPSLIGQGSLFNRPHTPFRRLLLHLQTAATQCCIERDPIGCLHLKPEKKRTTTEQLQYSDKPPFAD
ncbi:hypothetical protein V1477_021316 [Vespula maculifrons]|uniref:Uncharacterized protein n=1 Tax=Vespula maculifrons TaxID=7453 RepID=A0ABD2AGT0_VESMC